MTSTPTAGHSSCGNLSQSSTHGMDVPCFRQRIACPCCSQRILVLSSAMAASGVSNREPVFICGGNSPFSYIASQRLIFDTETRLFYEFPRFKSTLIRAPSSSDPITCVTLTNTHIVSLSYHVDRTIHYNSPMALVFSASPMKELYFFIPKFDRGPPDSLHFPCIDLTLPNHTSTDAVLPITIDSHDITVVNHVPLDLKPSKERHIVFSDDGHVRGLWIFGVPDDCSWDSLADALTMRFTIDASRDKCVAVLGQISVPLWKRLERLILIHHFLFDLARGMICYDRNVTPAEDDDGPAVITYIK
ncbi:hypothetical protein EV363DRAFT_1272798 [Boletus edulis]|uniref:Uncharacterized protein n=1 Tax=Boletus edulis BED1 TaxID=1328754 RepID=A0AAD4G9U1_BOLED|nr:hypothetical protein EV363DRAFT_1272798 [Boletus edulis]KAF8419227.1 hypothetical protein L210DRAFT_3766703 [Boletus edulis BED1]KAF8430998.1 hypothetical protein L210DRAFT_3764385 [Boletus edulis BED1]